MKDLDSKSAWPGRRQLFRALKGNMLTDLQVPTLEIWEEETGVDDCDSIIHN